MIKPQYIHDKAWEEYELIKDDKSVPIKDQLNAAASLIAAVDVCMDKSVDPRVITLRGAVVDPKDAKFQLCDCDLWQDRSTTRFGRTVVSRADQILGGRVTITAVDFKSTPWYHGPNAPERRSLKRA
jgi:hypothetical protein